MGPTKELCRLVTSISYQDLPASVTEKAKDLLINAVGIAVAGSTEDASRKAVALVKEVGGAPQCTVVGAGLKTSAPWAAFANGVTAHANDADDSGVPPIIHPSAGVLGALLAAGELGHASGKELLTAYVLCMESMARLERAAGHSHFMDLGFHAVGPVCHMGAAVAAAKLLRLDAAQAEHALGLAASTSSGIRAQAGSMSKPFHGGNASLGGIMSALLAKEGVTAVEDVLEHRWGWCKVFGQDGANPGLAAQGFGDPWFMEKPGFIIKATPGGTIAGPIVEWLTQLRASERLTGEDVVEVQAGVNPIFGTLMWHTMPQSLYQAKYSNPFRIALVLARGRADIRDYTPDTLQDPTIRALLPRIKLYIHPDLANLDRAAAAADPRVLSRSHVMVRLKDGRQFTAWVETCKGYVDRPFTRAELRDRFHNATDGILPRSKATAALQMLEDLDKVKDVGQLVTSLATSAGS
ncbi:MAG: MmgE/PrpD family protein [Chloroflexi bacterium]|nr:MmgE/PrpD family protein [Chloroflexota bacterium]